MQNFTYFSDFERTKFTDDIHGVLGRSLIVATRFDNLCKSLARFIDYKTVAIVKTIITDDEYGEIVNKILGHHTNLNRVIKGLPIDNEIKEILHKAREARNSIAHSLAIGLEGVFDFKEKNEIDGLIDNIKKLIEHIIKGDVIISAYISTMNKESIPACLFEKTYEEQVVDWVITRHES